MEVSGDQEKFEDYATNNEYYPEYSSYPNTNSCSVGVQYYTDFVAGIAQTRLLSRGTAVMLSYVTLERSFKARLNSPFSSPHS